LDLILGFAPWGCRINLFPLLAGFDAVRQSAFDTRAGMRLRHVASWGQFGRNGAKIHDARTVAEEETRMFEKDLLAGKRILVTGGGSGLGAAMGRRFLELGAELLICGRRLDVLDAAADAMRRACGGKVTTFRCDIRDGAAVDAMMDTIWRDAPLHVLVNNAAATFIAQTEQLSFRAADAILAPTLHGAMYCTLAAGRRWIEAQENNKDKNDEHNDKRKAVVLSILSTSTITGRAFTVPSAMAKSAVLAMTRSLAVEWGPKGIRTVAIAPGAFPTAGATGQLRPKGREQGWASRNPLGRAGEHHELANLASFLISDSAGYINGEMVVQDGGAHLRSSGAEDLLHWTEEQWEMHRASRAKG
jgi:NAD(P)-dependent dehydrogenase (short-subunit alcohol dehydrogenase family)